MIAGAFRVEGRTVVFDPTVAATVPVPRRALVSVSDKRGLDELGRGLAGLGFELVSTGGTARALREAGVEVTDVSAVTGFPEMLDGRVKTLHPRIAAGVLADGRSADHRDQLAAMAIDAVRGGRREPLSVRRGGTRAGVTADELIEEIDIGGPTLVRAAAKNHASVAIVTDPDDYPRLLAALASATGVTQGMRRELAVSGPSSTRRATTRPSRRRCRACSARPDRCPRVPVGPAATPPMPPTTFPSDWSWDSIEWLSCATARTRTRGLPCTGAAEVDGRAGPFALGAAPLQGKPLWYNNILDASAAATLARDLTGPAVAIVKHTNPCGVAEADDLGAAWDLALAGDPVSAFGGVVAVRGPVDGALAERIGSIFLEVVVAERFEPAALEALASKPGLRLLEDPGIVSVAVPVVEVRSAGGAVLVSDADRLGPEDDPGSWRLVTRRGPTPDEARDLSLAWRVCRHVTSNAIVLVRGGAVVGVGAGQMSRVDSARLAVAKAGPERAAGASCASDAFFPFADGVEACTAAGVSAFAQPGGSQRDAEVVAAADRAGAAMMLTGRRHFRH